MDGCNNLPRRDRTSIKYKGNPDAGVSLKLADFVHQDYVSAPSGKSFKQCSKIPENKSSKILNTAQLTTVVGQLWDVAIRPLAFFRPKGSLNQDDNDCEKEVVFGYLEKANISTTPSPEPNTLSVDRKTDNLFSTVAQPNLSFLSVKQKMSVSERHSENHKYSRFWKLLQDGRKMSNESWKGEGLASVEISCELENLYEWMNEVIRGKSNYPANVIESDSSRIGEYCGEEQALEPTEGCISGESRSDAEGLTTGITEFTPDLVKSNCSSSLVIEKLEMNKTSNTSLYSDYVLNSVQDIELEAVDSVLRTPSVFSGYYITSLPSWNGACEEYEHKSDSGVLPESKQKQTKTSIIEEKREIEIGLSVRERPRYALAKQEHAFAGALAGAFVSICLHPVDTVKTVIQTCQAEQRSACYIGKSIISDRGLFGLYRGIATNIASSAPISAIYTFTYESVKGALLPLFPREYHSFAHCVAGGCASIATSFIFTPSERIKQQMQISSQYRNCWYALVGIIEKGGFSSLYAGWGAVLCRNIPHSVIKFYAYERLKELILPLSQCNAQPSTFQTLVCGGLAGSTAALFTTPFDVVKTRLQTQIPGSLSQYNSVIHALQEIGKREGLKGLYRGLTPRLVMYMSQGALFFASYEFFKGHFSLDQPHHSFDSSQCQQQKDDDST